MNVTLTAQTQYTTASANTEKTNKEGINPTKGQDYVLKTLDDEGNELLNQILEGKTDQEKWMLKLSLDMGLSTEVKNGRVENVTDIDNSKNSSFDRLGSFIEERKRLFTQDILGTDAIAQKLLEAYKSNSTFINSGDREDSVVDKFLEDLYSKESISFSAKQTQENIQNKVNEYAKTLVDEMEDTPESQLDVSILLNDYKKELLEEYKDSLKKSNDGSLTLEQQAIIKVLLDDNSKETSHLEKLLTMNSDASINKKYEAKTEYADSGLPDWMDQKINTIYSVSEGNNIDSGRGWFNARLRLGAIAMSGGQSDMKINEENLDWKEVLEFTAESFKNNMQSSHTNEMAEKYENFLNKPDSQYYSYSDEIKQQMIEQHKLDNHALNEKGFSATEVLLEELKVRESSILQSNTPRIDSVNMKE
ncbi:MAG: hypothetical protein ACI9TV_001939 [Sulfurimonas sp.]|jgi:hypothetical protein|uniref:hypothetical protein n=1 Tax=Sulfurimonas sp. TaxID=2022749 RepID=UPI0039E239C7